MEPEDRTAEDWLAILPSAADMAKYPMLQDAMRLRLNEAKAEYGITYSTNERGQYRITEKKVR